MLYPGSILPLRIFEVRYLDMIRRCIDNAAPFGVVSLIQGNEVSRPQQTESFAHIGTLATIISHESPQPGLRVIRCVGQQRFRAIRTERLKHGLWVSDVEYLPDDTQVNVPDELLSCKQLFETMLARMPQATRRALFSEEPDLKQLCDCGWLANRWCQLLPLPLEMKQRLLELTSPLIRLELISDLIEKLGLQHDVDSSKL